MLCELSIKNFAIIDDLTIRFDQGLTVLSGETGAGKSVIVNAVNLLLGSRASAKLIRTGAETAELEALFELPPESRALEILGEQGYDPSSELIIRRIIAVNDRHRIYINGRLATMQLLAAVTENLATISGQHEHQRLLAESEHLAILDRFAGLGPLREDVRACYNELKPLIQKRDALQNRADNQRAHADLLRFQQKEIADAGLTPGEDAALKQEQARLKNAETLYQTAFNTVEVLYAGQGAVSEKLVELRKQIDRAAAIDPDLGPAARDIAEIGFRTEDIARHLRTYMDTIRFDPGRLEEIESRIDRINRLKRKYGPELADVTARLSEIEKELADLENLSDKIAETEKQLADAHARLSGISADLSARRRSAAAGLAQKLQEALASLKMENTLVDIAFFDHAALNQPSSWLICNGKPVTDTGLEQACFMISPNVGEALKPLSAIASGGELSRTILALKSIMTPTDTDTTLIFDEVDAGIGGETAEQVGKKLADLATRHQVICITHLAQIAKFADHHYRIVKQVEDGRTLTRIFKLDDDQRLEETARMIGGAEITRTTREHAGELLTTGRRYSPNPPP